MEVKINIEIEITGEQFYYIVNSKFYLENKSLRDFFEGQVHFIDWQPIKCHAYLPNAPITPEELQLPLKRFERKYHPNKDLIVLRMEDVSPRMKDKVREYLAKYGLELNF